MKWIGIISLAVVFLAFNISAYAAEWNAAEHNYHTGNYCSRMPQRAESSDTPDCQNCSGATSYSCCCDTCNQYLDECLNVDLLSKETCKRIKTNCEHDCNTFLSNQPSK